MFGRGTSLSLSLSLSLVARTFWHTFGLNLKGFFTHFVVVFSRFIVNFSYFVVVLTHIFTHKRRFLGHCAFLKFLNALFLGFLCLSLRAVFAKTAWQSINLALFLLFGLPRSLCSLAMTARLVILSVAKNPKILRYALFMDTSLALSMTKFMTNLGFCLRITDIFTQSLGTKFTNFTRFYGLPRSLCSLAMTARQKFKFFTQNSKHFTNSTHFITLSQNLSLMQGFFISLPQIFEQFLLINLVERRNYGSSWHKRQDKNSRAD